MNNLLKSAAERATRYLDQLDERTVAPSADAFAQLERFDEPLPDQPTDPETVLRMLDEIGSPATVATAGRRFFGFVIGGSLPVTLAANWLAGAWDQNAGLFVASPVAATLEEIALRWLVDVLALPRGTGGAFVTGTTVANLTALAAARHFVLQKAGWDVEANGLFDAPPVTVVVGAEAHPTLFRALALLGLGRNRVVTVPVDPQGRMRADAFPKFISPAIVCIQSGNVNTGAFDPATEIIAKAHAAGAWVHVDGAFGLWAAVSPPPRAFGGRRCRRGLVGNGRAQVAQRSVRQRSRACSRSRKFARGNGSQRRVSATGRSARAIPIHSGAFATRARD